MNSDSASDLKICMRAPPVDRAGVVGIYAPVAQVPAIHIETPKQVHFIYYHDLLDKSGLSRKRRSYEAAINLGIDRILKAKDYFLATSDICVVIVRTMIDLQMASGIVRSAVENKLVSGIIITHYSLSEIATCAFWMKAANEVEQRILGEVFDDQRIVIKTFSKDDEITKYHIHII